jgi:hypothetical protein
MIEIRQQGSLKLMWFEATIIAGLKHNSLDLDT